MGQGNKGLRKGLTAYALTAKLEAYWKSPKSVIAASPLCNGMIWCASAPYARQR